MSVGVEPEARRRRRTPEAARREIIEAAQSLLRERPFRDLTVDEVMRRTGLSRPSFYVYFRDRHELVLRVVQHVSAELFTMANRWYQGVGSGVELQRQALEGVIGVYEEHGAVLRALADAAADDPEVESAWTGLIQSFIDATAQHIEREVRAGRVTAINPHETAKALIWMNERYLYLSYGAETPVPREIVLDTLTTIWNRAVYGRI